MRIGFGYDVHALTINRKLIMGGVDIPHSHGLLGHSDADVLLHAICDALLGAAGLGDIGKHFPDTDNKFKDISSLILLKEVRLKIQNAGFKISNIDCVVIAEAPKISKYIPKMIENIANALDIASSCINIKATTAEGLGAFGRKEGIAANAVTLLDS